MAVEPREGRYLTRENYRELTRHRFDELQNIGYDWRTNLIEKSVSPYLLNDSKRSSILNEFRKIIVYIMDYASQIKKGVNYTVDKNYKYLN